MVTKEEWAALDKRLNDWMKRRGQRELEDAARESREAAQKIRDELRVDPETLRKPTTI